MRRVFMLAATLSVLIGALLMVSVDVPVVRADITCENSDYNCIYVDITDGSSGNRIVCTRAVCGGGSFGGRQYRLEGLYAFDGVNPNSPTTTLPSAPLGVSVSGASVTATGTGSCSYVGGTYLDAGFANAWNTVNSPVSVSCNWSGSFLASNLEPGRTYFLRITFSDSTGSVTGSSSFVAPPQETTTTLPPVTTTTIAGATVNPCLDPSNPNFACGWAILGPDNQVGGVIVCTFAVCGTGSFGGMRLALQTQQMEGGNVAGWSGGTYDEATQTFSLPGGGTLRSGERLEDAVFPPPTIDVEAVGGESGAIYDDVDSYVKSESDVVITSNLIRVELPKLPAVEIDYAITFDPDGIAPPVLIERGTLISDSVEVRDQVLQSMVENPVVRSTDATSTITIDQRNLRGRAGRVKVRLKSADVFRASVIIRITAPRKYPTCAALLRDYPGGIASPRADATRMGTQRPSASATRPTVNMRVFALNRLLDIDRDFVVCERDR